MRMALSAERQSALRHRRLLRPSDAAALDLFVHRGDLGVRKCLKVDGDLARLTCSSGLVLTLSVPIAALLHPRLTKAFRLVRAREWLEVCSPPDASRCLRELRTNMTVL